MGFATPTHRCLADKCARTKLVNGVKPYPGKTVRASFAWFSGTFGKRLSITVFSLSLVLYCLAYFLLGTFKLFLKSVNYNLVFPRPVLDVCELASPFPLRVIEVALKSKTN